MYSLKPDVLHRSKGALKVYGNLKMIFYFLYMKLNNLIMWFYLDLWKHFMVLSLLILAFPINIT